MKISRTLVTLGTSAALVATALFVSPAANAADAPTESPTVVGGALGLDLSTADLTALKSSLDSSSEVLGVEVEGDTRTTTYEVEGYQVAIEEEKVESTSPGLYWDVNTQYLPRYIFVYLYKADQQALAAGGLGALNAALCAIPAIGLIGCIPVTAALQSAGEYLKANGLCKGTFAITFDFNSNPKPWIRYACQ